MTQLPNDNLSTTQVIGQEELLSLKNALGPGPVLVLTHANPDPDALASGIAFADLVKKKWNIDCDLFYTGLVDRAENREMLHLLTPEWKKKKVLEGFENYSATILLDTQPRAGNNLLPESQPAHVVIDHHNPLRECNDVLYKDIRPEIGANATILFQYLEAAGIKPDPRLATAMFYGLKTDTRGLSRGTSLLDEEVYIKLLHFIDHKALIKIEQAGLSRGYFRAIGIGLQAAEVCDAVGFAYLEEVLRPDLLAEIADLFIRLNEVKVVLCLGYYGKTLHLSLRTKNNFGDAGMLVQKIVHSIGKAGGHGTIAGGQVSIRNRPVEQMVKIIKTRFLNLFDVNEEKCFGLMDE